jgi:hypothetical protein
MNVSIDKFRDDILAPAPGVIGTMIEEDMMLFATEGSRYIELKGVAVRIWELIQLGSHSAGQIAGILCDEFEADPALIDADLAGTLADLEAHRLIRRS